MLKSLNLSLEDSRQILSEQSMAAVLLAHKTILKEEIERLQASLKHTQSLLNILDLQDSLHWEDLIALVAGAEKEKRVEPLFFQGAANHFEKPFAKTGE
nr:hypothetical protein [Planococcus glaciei]